MVEITALLLTKITLRKFVSVKSVNDNGDISTTPPTFFSKTKKSKKVNFGNVDQTYFFFGF